MQAFAVASTAFQVVGDLLAGNEAAKTGARNADLLNERANMTAQAYGQREENLRQRNRETLSAQRVAMLQNGVDPGTGTALIGTEQQMRDAELDALTLRYQGILESRDLRIQAAESRYQGQAAKRQSRLSAVGKLLNAGGDYLRSSGFGVKGPGFSDMTRPGAPVESRIPSPNPYYRR